MSAAAKFAPNPHRRAMVAKVHMARKELGLDEDTYRAALKRVTGKSSAGDMNDGELVRVLDDFKTKGWKAKAGRPAPAAHPVARKARALWISLAQLGVVRDPSERGLESFAKRQLGVERLAWADQSQGYKLIEALKAMAERAGWSQELAGVEPEAHVAVLKQRLVERLVERLDEVTGERPLCPAAANDDAAADVWLGRAGNHLRAALGLPLL